jgi:hypothetical protein
MTLTSERFALLHQKCGGRLEEKEERFVLYKKVAINLF